MPLLLALLLSVTLFCTGSPAVSRGVWQKNEAALRLLEQHEYAQAIDLLQQAVNDVPSNRTLRKNLVSAYLAAAQAQIRKGDYQKALSGLTRGKDLDDQDSRLWLLSGIAQLKSGDTYAAELELNEAWAMSGDEPRVLQYLGQLYYDTDRMFEAVDAWQRALSLDPKNKSLKTLLTKAERELAVEKELDRNYSGHFILSYAENHKAEVGGEVLEALEEAYDWAGSRLGHYPERQTPVLLYTQRQFSGLTGSPEWAAGLYDGKIRLSIGGLTQVDAPVRALLFHEFMHVVVREISGSRVPSWLNEGLAELAAREEHSPKLRYLQAAHSKEKLFTLASLAGSFRAFKGDRIALAYEQSYSFVRYLLDRFGWFEMSELLSRFRQGYSTEEAVLQVYGDYGVDLGSLERDWKRQL